MKKNRSFGWTLLGLATLGLVGYLGYSMYPEAMRTIKMHSM